MHANVVEYDKNPQFKLEDFITALKLKNLTVFLHDWGSTVGLYLAGTKLETFDRIILGNGGLPIIEKPFEWPIDIDAAAAGFERTINQIPPQQPYFFDESGKPLFPTSGGDDNAFAPWAAYAMYSKNFRASKMLETLTFDALTADELAAYDAPFPTQITMAGPRAFPSLLNQMIGLSEPAMKGSTDYKKPFLTIFGANEPVADQQKWYIDNVPGAAGQDHYRFRDASHFLQDDKGQEVAERVNRFMLKNPR